MDWSNIYEGMYEVELPDVRMLVARSYSLGGWNWSLWDSNNNMLACGNKTELGDAQRATEEAYVAASKTPVDAIKEIVGTDGETFVFEWGGNRRTPQTITHNGEERRVSYMRDGVILFSDNQTAFYSRVIDSAESPTQSIVVSGW